MLLNAQRFLDLARSVNVDALIATSPENVTYASGYWALSQWIRRGPQTYVVLLAPDLAASHLIAATSLLDLLADQDVWVENIHRFGQFAAERNGTLTDELDLAQAGYYDLPAQETAIQALIEVIASAGLSKATIAVDELGLLPGHWEMLESRFPRAIFIPGSQLFRSIRAIKTGPEVDRLRQVAQITERSIAAALEIAEAGASELDLARAFHSQTVKEDALPVLGCIGFGSRSAMPNVQPSATPLADDQVIRFDVGGRYRHYRADIARIAFFGEPDLKTRQYHEALNAGVQVALEAIRPGVRAADVFNAGVDMVRRDGIPHYRRHHIGHGIGIDGYDLPDISAHSPDVFEEGMVLCVETPFYELGWCGLQVEDMVVVRADGVETLMTTDGKLEVVS